MRLLASSVTALTVLGGVFGWETVQDAARLSRELVKAESIATLATVYPSDYRDAGLANHPFALMEYYASCHKNGSLTYLFFPISQNARNVASAPGKTASFTVRVGDSAGHDGNFAPDVGSAVPGFSNMNQMPLGRAIMNTGWWDWSKSMWGSRSKSTSIGRGPAAAARVALMGRVKVYYGVTGEGDSEVDREAREMSACFLEKHSDAKWWVPGRPGAPHVAWWARFDPESVYYVGGFGNEHYIGWIPLDLYRNSSSSGIYF